MRDCETALGGFVYCLDAEDEVLLALEDGRGHAEPPCRVVQSAIYIVDETSALCTSIQVERERCTYEALVPVRCWLCQHMTIPQNTE